MDTTTRRGNGRGTVWKAVLCLVLLAGLAAVAVGWSTFRAQLKAASWEKERPQGPDHITPRMSAVRDAIVKEFHLKGTPGCYRAEGGIAGGGEHPLGRACDFMLGPTGKKATGDADVIGDRIVAWVREHADEYGIWYVIYEQHIWSSRWPQQGFDPMEDRGSITQNHYDHVHISVY